MPNYLSGVLVAFLEPILHAWCNILDNYFSNRVFPRLSVLLFFGTVLNIAFLPIVFFVGLPEMLTQKQLLLVFIIGVIDVAYLFPYYWALRRADTSIVASLFALGKIFIPVLAFFVIGESLAPLQYAGFALIVLSATALTLDLKQLKVNTAFFLMFGVSLVLSIQTILYKYTFESGASWPSVVTTLMLFQIIISGIIMLAVNSLRDIREDAKKIRSNLGLFGAQQGLEWGGNASSSYAVSILPVTVAQSISGTQPLFVLAYALAFKRHFPGVFHEHISKRSVWKKGVFFGLMIAGTALVVTYGTYIDM